MNAAPSEISTSPTATHIPYSLLVPAVLAIVGRADMGRGTYRDSTCLLDNGTPQLVSSDNAPPVVPRRVRCHRARSDAQCVSSGVRSIAIRRDPRSEEHTSELQSLMRISYAVFCLKKKK